MTCIAGLVEDGVVYIGADSAGANGWTTRPVAQPKVFRTGPFLIGYTTSFRFGQLLQTQLDVRQQFDTESDYEFMVKQFAESVRTLLKERGFAKVDSNHEEGGGALVGYRGRLYLLAADYAIIEHQEGIDAVGSGEDYAIAAMVALQDNPPRGRIMRALEIAAQFSSGVCPPFVIETLGETV